MKTKTQKSPYTLRSGIPTIKKDKDGNAVLLCPFCKPTHTLHPDIPSACGTKLILTAEQAVFRAKFNKKMICAKCHNGGGEMVIYQGGYIHTHDCAPGVMTMTVPPEFSDFAKHVYGFPEWIKKRVQRYTGVAVPVEEILPNGTRTGVVLGYFFHQPKEKG